MRPLPTAFAALFILVVANGAPAETASRQKFVVATPSGEVVVETFGKCVDATCPAVVVLSGSRGFGSPAYDEIGQSFREHGLSTYLVHVLSDADLEAIASAGSARARLAYYARRLQGWSEMVRDVVAYLDAQPRHDNRLGVMGISLGAQIAAVASTESDNIRALALVDGGFPNGHPRPTSPLPPLQLIWGSADRTFPLSVGRQLHKMAVVLGGQADIDVYEGGAHDFFLRAGTKQAGAAHRSAARFFASRLSQ